MINTNRFRHPNALLAVTLLLNSIGCSNPKPVAQEPEKEVDARSVFLKANQSCPIRMDAFVTLCEVNMVDLENVEFIYEVNEKGTPAFKLIDGQKIRDGIIKRVKSGSMAKVVIRNNLTMHHTYFGFDGDVIGEYQIDKYDLTGKDRPAGSTTDSTTDSVADDGAPGDSDKETASSVDNSRVEKEADETNSEDKSEVNGEVGVEPTAENSDQIAADVIAAEEPPEPELPQAITFEKAKKSDSNPAGVQSNPFFNND